MKRAWNARVSSVGVLNGESLLVGYAHVRGGSDGVIRGLAGFNRLRSFFGRNWKRSASYYTRNQVDDQSHGGGLLNLSYSNQMASEEEQEPFDMHEEERKANEAKERRAEFEESYHPLRLELANEIHARPSLSIEVPLKARYMMFRRHLIVSKVNSAISYLVYHTGDDVQSFNDCVQHLCALCHRYNVAPPSSSRHVTDGEPL